MFNVKPVYSYVSTCCGTPATKPSLVKPKKDENQKIGLGKWRCLTCGKPCKTRVVIPLDNTSAA